MSENEQANNPLQLGQTLYEILDLTVIGTPSGAAAAQYNRIVVDASTGAKVVEPLALVQDDKILEVKSATDMHTGTGYVLVLTQTDLRMIGSKAGAATVQTWPLSGVDRIVGFDPQQILGAHLLLLGHDDSGVYLGSLDCSSGVLSSPLRLPPSIKGTVIGATLVRQQLDAHLVLITVENGTLAAHDLGSSALGPTPTSPTVTSVALGAIEPSGELGFTTAHLVAGTSDQQIAISYFTSAGALKIVALGWQQHSFAALATAAPVLFAVPEAYVVRIDAGNLHGEDIDQLVVGFRGAYGSVAGCAALLLYELKPAESGGGFELSQLSNYALSRPEDTPFASIDLHLAVGLFGGPAKTDLPAGANGVQPGALGVIVVGHSSSFAETGAGEAKISACSVTVEAAAKTFPHLGDKPAVPEQLWSLMTTDYRSSGFRAVASDLTGQSVILGPPKLSQSKGKAQILAVLQAPPFETAVSHTQPTLSWSTSQSDIKGYNVSSNKMWSFSKDVGQTIGIDGETLGRTTARSYGHGFDKVEDNSKTTLMQATETISNENLLILSTMSYEVWTYDVYRKAGQDAPDGSLLVVFPMNVEPIQTIIVASDKSLGYKPTTENGVLLSYVGSVMDGYSQSDQLFRQIAFPVTADVVGGGGTFLFDNSKMVVENIGKSTMVHNTTTDNMHLSFTWNLFDYLPINYGLNVTDGQNYSDSEIATTSLSHTTTLSLTITSGLVTDSGYEYEVTPYIYQHTEMGCLMVAYDVALTGELWSQHNVMPDIRLISLMPTTKNVLLKWFSRSITFAEGNDGMVVVEVELFNNSLNPGTNVVCDFYKGAPTVVQGKDKLAPSGTLVGSRTVETMVGHAREKVNLPMKLTKGDQVVVQVYVSELKGFATQVYWGIYPASAYMGWEPNQ